MHGTNRLGSNADADACTFGFISGYVTATGESGSQYSEWYRWDEHQSNYVTGVFASGATTRTWDNKTVFYEDGDKEYYYFR